MSDPTAGGSVTPGSPPATADGASSPASTSSSAGPQASPPQGLAQAFAEQFSLEQAIGGRRGLVEAVVPMTLFSVVYGLGAGMRPALVAAIVPAVVFVIWRLVIRQPVTHAISGLFGIALGAWLALRTGRAEDFVVPSLVKNSVQALVFGISALSPWPLLGLIIGLLRGEGMAWRRDPERLRAYRRATWLWSGMFAVRLAVQVPLWLAGAAAALGFANVLLGLPLFGLVVWLTWAIVREHHNADDFLTRTAAARPRARRRHLVAERLAELSAEHEHGSQASREVREPGPVRPDASPG